MTPKEYFSNLSSPVKKQYDALREYFHYGVKAKDVAKKYGYTETAFYWLIKDFKFQLQNALTEELFFRERALGRKPRYVPDEHKDFVVNLRKHNYSADDIVVIGQAKGYDLKYNFVYELLKDEGFAPLFRRTKNEKEQLDNPIEQAPRSEPLVNRAEKFSSNNLGIMAFLPIIRKYDIDKVIGQSPYPQTKVIDKLSSILSFHTGVPMSQWKTIGRESGARRLQACWQYWPKAPIVGLLIMATPPLYIKTRTLLC